MMDLGFGAFLEKFEEYFGPTATRIFLILIGLAVAALSVGAIWTWLVAPVLAFVASPERTAILSRLLLIFFAGTAGVALGMAMLTAFRFWRQFKASEREFEELEKQSDELIKRGEAMLANAEAVAERAERILAATTETYGDARRLFELAQKVAAEKAASDQGD